MYQKRSPSARFSLIIRYVSGEAFHRVVVVDDSEIQCFIWRQWLERRFGPKVKVEYYCDPTEAVEHLGPDIDLLLLDWEMPVLDGEAVLKEAIRRGVNVKRVIVTSSHPADRLHEVFDCTGCLAVIEKEPTQLAACAMILDEVVRCEPVAAAQSG